MKNFIIILSIAIITGCATLTSDPMTPVAFSFGDGSYGECSLTNKRGSWSTEVPATVSIRRSDDVLKYDCKTEDGREAQGSIASGISGKIVASAVFLDFGITDAITDKHREYPASFVIPVEKMDEDLVADKPYADSDESVKNAEEDIYSELEKLSNLRDRGIITDAEFESEKQKILNRN